MCSVSIVTSTVLFVLTVIPALAQTWKCELLPEERKVETDKKSGARIIFITTDPAADNNLYFHDRCWMFDQQLMLFNSNRTGRTEVFGYITETGALVRFNRSEDPAAFNPVASAKGDRFYVFRGKAVFEWSVELIDQPEWMVFVTQRKICELPAGAKPFHSLNENSDGSLISLAYTLNDMFYIDVANIQTGEISHIAALNFRIQHLQFSRERPYMMSFARSYGSDTAPDSPEEPPHARIWLVNVMTKTVLPLFYQAPGELVTHECWWKHDQITFIGGYMPEEAHVKVVNIKTAEIRIIGAGAWVEGVPAKELSKENWWHASGSPDGRWVAADNWHGIIAIFDGRTTRKRILTTGHRTYGKGAHPHVGWDLNSTSVEFTSNKLGNPDVCIGELPEDWLKEKLNTDL